MQNNVIELNNNLVSIRVDLNGGAIVSFILNGCNINPIAFSFTKEQMPDNNKAGASYQGHFACIGRWGAPSAGEIKAGLPHHGEPANTRWTLLNESSTKSEMTNLSKKEGLEIRRQLSLDATQSIYCVIEKIENINPLGRFYNIVQHPTLAAPFLDQQTLVDCNATLGFDQANYKNIAANTIEWPTVTDSRGQEINLRNPTPGYNGVFSFIVNPGAGIGWITAYNPSNHLLIGYAWKRSEYPWIHLWQHYDNGQIRYRGIEFGTAGIHQPFNEILNTAINLFGEKTTDYIDAGQIIQKGFVSFTYLTSKDFTGVSAVELKNGKLFIRGKTNDTDHYFELNKKQNNVLQG